MSTNSTNLASLQNALAANQQQQQEENQKINSLESQKTTYQESLFALNEDFEATNDKFSLEENKLEAKIEDAIKEQEQAEKNLSDDIASKTENVIEQVENGDGDYEILMTSVFSGISTSSYLSDANSAVSEAESAQSQVSSVVSCMGAISLNISTVEGQITSINAQIATSVTTISTLEVEEAEIQEEIEVVEAEIAAEEAASSSRGGGDGGDPYEVFIDDEMYMFIRDTDDDDTCDDKSEILGITDTTDNKFAEMTELDTDGDGTVSNEELTAANVKLAKINDDGQVTDELYDMDNIEGIDLSSFEDVDDGTTVGGTFEVSMADGTTSDAVETFEDEEYFENLFSGTDTEAAASTESTNYSESASAAYAAALSALSAAKEETRSVDSNIFKTELSADEEMNENESKIAEMIEELAKELAIEEQEESVASTEDTEDAESEDTETAAASTSKETSFADIGSILVNNIFNKKAQKQTVQQVA